MSPDARGSEWRLCRWFFVALVLAPTRAPSPRAYAGRCSGALTKPSRGPRDEGPQPGWPWCPALALVPWSPRRRYRTRRRWHAADLDRARLKARRVLVRPERSRRAQRGGPGFGPRLSQGNVKSARRSGAIPRWLLPRA